MNFMNKTVMITGANGNLGQAVVNAFALAGANIVLVDLPQKTPCSSIDPLGERRFFMPTNLLDNEQVLATVRAAIARFTKIDILCNIAGGFRMGSPVHETSDDDWNFLFDINARSMLHVVRAVVPGMIVEGGGKIINIGANAALKGVANMGGYCAAKDVVIRLTEAMAAELREHNINVNCVLPSILDTSENRAAMPAADPSRWVTLEALSDVITFLASDNARAIHGAAIPVIGRS